MRLLAPLALAAALLVAPAEAMGARLVGQPLQKAIWGPIEIDGVSQFPRYRDLGVKIFQTTLRWHQVARRRPADPLNPADPSYRWPEEIDRAIEEGRRHGIQVLIHVIGTAGWANDHIGWSHPPKRAQDFATFVRVVARRYPAVRHWLVWGEPLRNLNFPGYPRDRGSRRALARVYARMLDASYVALKAESRQNLVIGGNTFTTDRKPVYWAPVPLYEWMRLLRLPNGRPPRMDLWGHNPFTTRVPSLRNGPGRSIGDISDTRRVVSRLRRYVARPLGRPLPIFISEFCVPVGENSLLAIKPTERQQADWIRRALRIARGQRMIWGFGYFVFQDILRGTRITCGLVDSEGRPKPSYGVFKRAPTARP